MKFRIESPVETIVGAVVLGIAIWFAVYAANAGVSAASRSTGAYEVYATFRSANGVAVGTDVRIAGVKVGRVSEVSLDPTTNYALVRMRVSESVELSDETIAIVDADGLLGGAFINLDPVPGFETLTDGGRITTTQGAVSFSTILARIVEGMGSGGGGGQGGAAEGASQ